MKNAIRYMLNDSLSIEAKSMVAKEYYENKLINISNDIRSLGLFSFDSYKVVKILEVCFGEGIKVIAKGILYTEQENKKLFKNEMVHLKKVKMVTTMSTPGWIYRTIFGSPVTKMVFRGTFRKMGFNQLKWVNFAAVQGMKLEKRQQLLKKFENNIVK